jgi:hypothetical protein
VGVKQGDTLAAILFLFVEQAAIETEGRAGLRGGGDQALKQHEFWSKDDDVIAGRKLGEDSGEALFSFWASLYASDGTLNNIKSQ